MPVPVLLLWLLPLLFVVHDLEEILFLKPWLDRNRDWLKGRFPALSRRLLPHFDRISRGAFAAMAAEELVLLIGVTVYAAVTHTYYPWLALWLAFGIHLVMHLAQWGLVRRYVPVAVTSLFCLSVWGCGLGILIRDGLFSGREYLLCGAVGCVVAAANLLLIHRVTAIFRH